MNMQQDPVGLITFDDHVHAALPARSRRGHLGDVLAHLSRLQPDRQHRFAGLHFPGRRHAEAHALVMLFSDLLPSGEGQGPEEVISALARLRHGGNDVIVFHVMDEAEVNFPYEGPVQFEDSESGETVTVDATGFRDDYLRQLEEFRERYRARLQQLENRLRTAGYQHAV